MSLTDVSITGTTTVTSGGYGEMHVCSGTSANYAVTLPTAVSAVAGTLLGFRMDAGLTKLVTLTSATGTQLDGAATRVMWANESCILESDGAQWRKIAGKAVPMSCFMRLTANQTSIADTTNTTILLNVHDSAAPSSMADDSNHRVLILRTSNYNVLGNVQIDGASMGNDASRLIGTVNRDPNSGSYTTVLQNEVFAKAGGYTSGCPQALAYSLSVNEKLQIGMYQNTGGSVSAYGNTFGAACTLSVCEVPNW